MASSLGRLPVFYPPVYEMLGISLHAQSRLAVVPIAVVNTGASPLLRFAVPAGMIPASRIKPRVGPILHRVTVAVRASEIGGGDIIWDSNGEEEYIDVDLVDAVHTAATSFWRAAVDFAGLIGFRAYGPDDVDGVAGLAVWPSLEDLLEHSVSLANRPTTLYDPAP